MQKLNGRPLCLAPLESYSVIILSTRILSIRQTREGVSQVLGVRIAIRTPKFAENWDVPAVKLILIHGQKIVGHIDDDAQLNTLTNKYIYLAGGGDKGSAGRIGVVTRRYG